MYALYILRKFVNYQKYQSIKSSTQNFQQLPFFEIEMIVLLILLAKTITQLT